jgi:hypothetical protein
MASTYTSTLKLEKPAQGEKSGVWGNTINNNITDIVEHAIAGLVTINTWTEADPSLATLTTGNGAVTESNAAILNLTDTGNLIPSGVQGRVIVPAKSKIYVVINGTGHEVQVQVSGQTGVVIPIGQNMIVACNGTTVIDPLTRLTLDQVLASGPIATDKQVGLSGSSTLTFGDNGKAQFGSNASGAGDLQIFHDGSHSYVKDVGTGDLRLLGANTVRIQNADGSKDYVVATTSGSFSGSVSILFDNSEKLRTSSSGTTTFGEANVQGFSSGVPSITMGTSSTKVTWTKGTNSPEGNVTANQGSIYSRVTSDAVPKLYSKQSGTGNTGWEPIASTGT